MSHPLKMLLLDQVKDAFCFLTPQVLALLHKAVVKYLQFLLATACCIAQQPAASITIAIYIQWLPGIRLLLQQSVSTLLQQHCFQ